MTVDLSQFHQVFFEESFENTDIMEHSLMDLEPATSDMETINAVFRAAHSIKGGSATFGFSKIASFTHVLETLLDQIRSGERSLTDTHINLFLKSVDCLRAMLTMLQSGEDATTPETLELTEQFNAILSGDNPKVANESVREETAKDDTKESSFAPWRIRFFPDTSILQSGNDPYRLFRELATLGEMKCSADYSGLPSLHDLDPEKVYLDWEITLPGTVSRESIQSVFDWIGEEAKVEIDRHEFNPTQTNSSTGENNEQAGDEKTFWSISFVPNPDMMITGNDPVKIFQSLAEIGEIQSIKATDKLPEFSTMNPEFCYLCWEIILEADNQDRDRINEVFDWVKDDAVIQVTPVSGIFVGNEQQKNQLASDVVEAKQNSAAASSENNGAKSAPAPNNRRPPAAEATSIRVGIDKVDNLINMVGELVITQSMLGQFGSDFDMANMPKLVEGLSQLEQNTRELQESVMRIRMLPISFVFSRFPRMVRDLGQTLGKEINLEVLGEQTELDKTVLEKIGDPLVHLVRNAVDHGIESTDERINKDKSPVGNVRLNAYHQGGNVVIEVVDDGKGLNPVVLKEKAVAKGVIKQSEADALSDEQAYDLIFHPGFSTAAKVSDVSGRGVGMDVVKRNIQALNGAIEIRSEVDFGSTLTIRLPLTLAILDGQLVRVGDQTYIFPIVSIVESVQYRENSLCKVAGGATVFRLRDEYVPIIKLANTFNISVEEELSESSLIVVVENEGEKVGVVVNELLAQQQVVIKSLEQNYGSVDGVSGATILGDGTVALIVDIPGIVRLSSIPRDINKVQPISNTLSFEGNVASNM